MTQVHPTAARGFDAVADLYERARPSYPAAAVDFIVDRMALRDAEVVADVGAGTGKFTRELVGRDIPCVAVEPLENMRATFAQVLPGVPIHAAPAERLPFDDASVDAILCAQAFHWFATDGAVGEFARVLRPGGMLGLVWNARDERSDWIARMTELFARYESPGGVRVPRHRDRAWREPLERSSAFDEVDAREFPHAQTLTPDGLVERFASISFIAVLPEDEREAAIAEVRALIASHPDLRGRTTFEHPYVTEVYLFRKRP